MIPEFKINHEKREKKGFNASDYGRMAFDIYHAFKGTEPTNPALWNETLKWGAGKGVELQMVKVLQDSGIVSLDWNQEEEETYEMERHGVKVRMKIDAFVGGGVTFTKGPDNTAIAHGRTHDLEVGAPIEIKSINNKNSIDIKKYADGQPRENYVGQLAIYMDYLGKDIGYLFVASVDGLSYFWLSCRRVKDRVYECGKTVVDLDVEYTRWAEIDSLVKNNVEPSPFDAGKYKIPIAEIDWSKVSTTDIGKARNGDKVIGGPDSWQILYSSYKDLILKAQGVSPGYTEEEIAQIKTLTTGYTTWKK